MCFLKMKKFVFLNHWLNTIKMLLYCKMFNAKNFVNSKMNTILIQLINELLSKTDYVQIIFFFFQDLHWKHPGVC